MSEFKRAAELAELAQMLTDPEYLKCSRELFKNAARGIIESSLDPQGRIQQDLLLDVICVSMNTTADLAFEKCATEHELGTEAAISTMASVISVLMARLNQKTLTLNIKGVEGGGISVDEIPASDLVTVTVHDGAATGHDVS